VALALGRCFGAARSAGLLGCAFPDVGASADAGANAADAD
jgi:hypothetical protein